MPTPIVEIAPLTGAEYEYDYQQLNRLPRETLISYCNSLRQRLSQRASQEGSTEEWIAREYLAIKFILAASLMLSSAEYAADKGLRIVEPYLAYYAIFNVSRALVLLIPEHTWNDGTLATETTHTKVLNITHDYLRTLDRDLGREFHTISQAALATRELFSYSFPALGFDSATSSRPPDLDAVVGICQAVAELAELHSECLQSAYRRVPAVALDRQSKTLRKLYEYEHRSGEDSFADDEDWYRLWQIERKLNKPICLHAMARQGLVEDFFGSWAKLDDAKLDAFDVDQTNWQIIFDFM